MIADDSLDSEVSNIDSAIEDVQIPESLYHYTDMGSLNSIISNKELWFSDIRYLNDANELTYSYDIMKRVFDSVNASVYDENIKDLLYRLENSLRDQVFDLFTISFSEHRDELSQWRGYGKSSSAAAIGFDLRYCDCDLPVKPNLIKIEYNEDRQIFLIKNLLEEYISLLKRFEGNQQIMDRLIPICCRYFRKRALDLSMRFKSRHWQTECEWRMVVPLRREDKLQRLRFRSASIGLVPYISSCLTAKAGSACGRLPLQSIVIAPGPHQVLLRQAVHDLIIRHGYRFHTPVEMSDVPLRI